MPFKQLINFKYSISKMKYSYRFFIFLPKELVFGIKYLSWSYNNGQSHFEMCCLLHSACGLLAVSFTSHCKLCNYAESKLISWAKSAYFDFFSSNFIVEDHILSSGAPLEMLLHCGHRASPPTHTVGDPAKICFNSKLLLLTFFQAHP
jgi:hypothetical protein